MEPIHSTQISSQDVPHQQNRQHSFDNPNTTTPSNQMPDARYKYTTHSTSVHDLESNQDSNKTSTFSRLSNVFTSTSLIPFLGMCLQSLGGIYGDLGTSPLYTYSSIFTSPPSREDVLGAASCIFWSITIVALLKYCVIIFWIGTNQKQGGAVAVYAKLASKLEIVPRGVEIPVYDDEENKQNIIQEASNMKRTNTGISFLKRQISHLSSHQNQHGNNPGGLFRGSSGTNLFSNPRKFFKKYFGWIPLFITFICTGLIMADGLLTPTTSVLSAVGGIAVVSPSFTKHVVLVSCVILGVVFVFQQLGSANISYTFGPVVCIWLIALTIVGIYNVRFHPGIFAAISPSYAIKYLCRKGVDGLGPVMLSITGTEAMFADLGHYSVWSVRFTMIFFCYPALVLSYFGQGARLITNPELYVNTFFMTIPSFKINADGSQTGGAIYWIVFVLATLATIIACQATILSVSSMYMQLENIDCLPKLSIIHTSKTHFGKIFIPFINYLMAAAVILTTIGFKNSNRVTSAYGFCIAFTFFFTTCLISFTMKACYNFPWIVVLAFFFSFGTLDMCFVAAQVKKIKDGAWFPLMLSILIVIFMCSWRWSRSLRIDSEFKSRVPLKQVLSKKSLEEQITAVKQAPVLDLNHNALTQTGSSLTKTKVINTNNKSTFYLAGTNQPIARLPGLALFHTSAYFTLNSPNTVPQIFSEFVKDFPSLHENLVFLGTRIINVPFVEEEERLTVVPIGNMPGLFRAIVRFGFLEPIVYDKELVEKIQMWTEQVKALSTNVTANNSTVDLQERSYLNLDEINRMPSISEELRCNEKKTSHVPPRPPVHIYTFESFHGSKTRRISNKLKKPFAWIRDGLINYVFEPIESTCRPKEVGGNVAQSDEYKQSLFTLTRTVEI